MVDAYQISDLAAKYILFQRTEYMTFTRSLPFRVMRKLIPLFNYNRMVEWEAKINSKKIIDRYLTDMEREYLSIKDFLPNNCSRLLDIGCGIAGIDIFLNQHYLNLNRDVDFFLLDKSDIEKNVYYMYEEKGAFYNSLDLAKETLVNNGIKKTSVHLIEATEKNEIKINKDIDLVLSLISWGYHYPVKTYLEKVYDLLSEGGVLILDIRKNTDGIDWLSQKFSNYRTVLERSKYLRVCAIK